MCWRPAAYQRQPNSGNKTNQQSLRRMPAPARAGQGRSSGSAHAPTTPQHLHLVLTAITRQRATTQERSGEGQRGLALDGGVYLRRASSYRDGTYEAPTHPAGPLSAWRAARSLRESTPASALRSIHTDVGLENIMVNHASPTRTGVIGTLQRRTERTFQQGVWRAMPVQKTPAGRMGPAGDDGWSRPNGSVRCLPAGSATPTRRPHPG